MTPMKHTFTSNLILALFFALFMLGLIVAVLAEPYLGAIPAALTSTVLMLGSLAALGCFSVIHLRNRRR